MGNDSSNVYTESDSFEKHWKRQQIRKQSSMDASPSSSSQKSGLNSSLSSSIKCRMISNLSINNREHNNNFNHSLPRILQGSDSFTSDYSTLSPKNSSNNIRSGSHQTFIRSTLINHIRTENNNVVTSGRKPPKREIAPVFSNIV